MKKRKIQKIKLKNVILFLIILLVIGFLVYYYLTLHVRNIYVSGNKLISEQEIIDTVGLRDYPKIIDVKPNIMEQKLKKNDLINHAKVNKSLLGKVTITIEENKILYHFNHNYMLSSGKIVSLTKDYYNVPQLINEVKEEITDKFVKKLLLIDDNIMQMISEMEYKPSDVDEERFMFYMNDGNYVYITLSKITAINSYQEIYPTLEGNKGILYLDSGNHFQIKKQNKE